MLDQKTVLSLLVAVAANPVVADSISALPSSSSKSLSLSSSSRSSSTLSSSSVSSSSSASSSSTSAGIGAAILTGLGQTSGTSSVSSTKVSSSSFSTITSTSASSVPYPASNSSIIGVSATGSVFDCQSALVAWDNSTSAIQHPYTSTYYSSLYNQTTTETVQYGTADVYTTRDGFARAHGNFTVTSTAKVKAVYTTGFTATGIFTPSSLQNVSLPPSPTCSIDPTSCNSLWKAYSSSLSLTGSNIFSLAPFIWPIPTNSPRCAITMTGCIETRNDPGCTISGNSVQLFYWPKATAAPSNANVTRFNATAPKTTVVDGVTMTSPSIYLSFDVLSAFTTEQGGKLCDTAADGAIAFGTVGGTVSNTIIALNPTDVSTLEKLQPNTTAWRLPTEGMPFPAAAVQAMATPTGSAYQYWASVISGASDYITAVPLDVNDLTHPNPRAYYLRPFLSKAAGFSASQVAIANPYAQGCNPVGDTPGCNTILEDTYRAQLALPEGVKKLDPAWGVCKNFRFGVYDPPVALTTVPDVIVPGATSDPAQQTSAAPGATQNSPTVSPTPLPDQKTSAASTLVALPSASNVIVPVVSTQTQTQNTVQPQSVDPGAGQSQNTPAQNTPSQNTPAQSTPSQNTPAQNTPSQNTPAQNTPSQNTPAQNTPSQNTPTQNTPAQNTPSQNTPSQNTPVNSPASQQTIAFTTPANTPANTQANTQANTPATQPSASNALQALTQTQAAQSPAGTQTQAAQAPAGTSQAPVAVISAGSTVVTASQVSGNAVIGGTTISSGAATVINGATISNAGTGVVVQPAPSQNSPVASVGTQAIVQTSGGAVVVGGSQTVSQGQAATIGGTVVSVGSSNVVVGGSTVPIASPAQNTPLATVGGQTVSAQAGGSGVVVGGSTLSQGQATTIAGTVVSVGSSNVVIGSSTIAIPSPTPTPLATVGGQTVSAQAGGSGVVVGGSTLSQGQAATIAGTVVSVGSSNVVIGSSTIALPSPAPTPLATVGGQTITPQSAGSGVVIGGSTLSAGQVTTISGTAVSVGSSAVVVGSSTITIPAQSNIVQTVLPSLTVGGSVITQGSSGQYVIGSQTLAPGGSAVTISGSTYSLGPSDSYVVVNGKTTSLAAPTTKTIGVTAASSGASLTVASPSKPVSSASASSTGAPGLQGAGSTVSAQLLFTAFSVVFTIFSIALV